MSRTTQQAFLKHLSFFDRNRDGLITLGELLRGNLSLGYNFPVSLGLSLGYQVLYGNSGPLRMTIDLARVTGHRTMLQHVVLEDIRGGLSRTEVLREVKDLGVMDYLHVLGLWTVAADEKGILTMHDVDRCQRGELLFDLEKRRRVRLPRDTNVLGFLRGGPGSVTGHAYVVKKLFDVEVYQDAGRVENKDT